MKRFTQIAVSALIVFAVSAALTSTAFAKGNGSGKSCHNNSCHNSCHDYCCHNYCNNYCYDYCYDYCFPTCKPVVVVEEPVCEPEVCVTPIYPYTTCYEPSFCSKPYCYKSGNFQKTMHKSMKSH